MTHAPGPPTARAAGIPAEVLVEALPAAVLVIDALGTVLALNERAALLVGRSRDEVLGRSVLDMVDPETSWAYAAATAMAADYPDVFMGPLRVTLLDASGTPRRADLWARNRLDDPDVGGIVCLLTAETAAVGLGEAVSALARHEPFEVVADRVVRALGGHPVNAAVVALHDVGDALAVVASTADAEVVRAVEANAEPDDEQPWHAVARSGVRELHPTLDALPASLARPARAAGYEALWCEAVTGPGGLDDVVGVLALWRARPGNPSPNELASVFPAAAVLSLAAALPTHG